MKIDLIPIGDRQFMVQLFAVSTIPDQIGFGRYYEGICEIALNEGDTILHECIVHRPKNNRNAVGNRQIDWLMVLITTDITQKQLSDAAIKVVQYGAELSEQEARTRRNPA